MRSRSGRARLVAAGPDDSDAGMVTAEFAVALPAFVLVLVAALSVVAIVTAQLRCTDAAATAARLAARGQAGALVRSTSLASAPGGASLVIAGSASQVIATVSARVSVPGFGGLLPGVTVRAVAVYAREPGSAASSAAP